MIMNAVVVNPTSVKNRKGRVTDCISLGAHTLLPVHVVARAHLMAVLNLKRYIQVAAFRNSMRMYSWLGGP